MTTDWLQRALELHRRERFDDVLVLCATAPADRKSQSAAQLLRATALAKLNRHREAVAAADVARSCGADSPSLLRVAISSCLAAGDWEKALEWIDRGLADHPDQPRLMEQREAVVRRLALLAGLHQHFELVLSLRPQSRQAREQVLRSCLRLRLFDEAEQHATFLRARDGDDPHLMLAMAEIYLETGRAPDAIGVLEAVSPSVISVEQRVGLATLLLRAGALRASYQAAEETVRSNPQSGAARVQAAFLSLWQGDHETALRYLEGLDRSLPGTTRALAALAWVEQQYEEAFELAGQAVAQDPRDAEACCLQAAAAFLMRRYDEALSASRAALNTADWLPTARLLEVGANAGLISVTEPTEVEDHLYTLAPLITRADLSCNEDGKLPSAPIVAMIEAALPRLSANFSSTITYVDDNGEWQPLRVEVPARVACVRAFDWIQARPMPWVAQQLLAMAARYPSSPFPYTHAAELWLWSGDYRACEDACRRALALDLKALVRWARVGLGAALMMQERYQEALEVYAESNRRVAPGAPLLAYRGEILRRVGQLEDAERDLTASLKLNPTRVSAWMNLALIAATRGEAERAAEIERRMQQHLPALMHDIARDLAVEEAHAPRAAASLSRHGLQVMRGNRSSSRITYFLRDGQARVQRSSSLD